MSVVWQLCMVLGLGAFSRYPPATMISRLPLTGTLYDDVQGTYALFVRDSSAYSADGQEVPPHTPRFETFAAFDNVEFETLSNGSNIAVYAHIGGTLYGSEYSPDCEWSGTLYFSTNGVNWQSLNEFHNTVRSAHVTDQGTLLVATARCQPVRIYRSEDGGQTFTVVAEFPYGRTVRHWGWAGQGDEVYITFHNGRYSSNNPRRIYRSLDDGRTWELFYEPPNQEGVHAHAIAFDPENRVVYYCHGDDLKGILRSADEGQTWEVLSLIDQPTGAVNRPDGVFFLSDTYRTAIITELDKSTGELLGRANLPEGPWGWHLLDDGGIMYAALQDYWFGKQGMVLASPDGRHWGILRRFSSGEQGPYSFAGTTELGYQWAVYLGVPDSPAVNVRFRTPTIKTVPGIRLEPGLVNLLASPEESSAEGGVGGWYAEQGGVLEQVTDRSHRGPRLRAQCGQPGAVPVGC